MDDVGVVEVEEAVEELVAEGFEDVGCDGGAEGLGVVVDELLGRDALGCVVAREEGSVCLRESHVRRTRRPCRWTCPRG